MTASLVLGLDAAYLPAGMKRSVRDHDWSQGPHLIAFDMDSTLIQVEVIDELARLHGVYDQVSQVTARAMAGELNFDQSLVERVALLKGLPWSSVLALGERLPLMPGAERLTSTLRARGWKTALLSGGFQFAADAVKHALALDHAHSNALEVASGELTGRVMTPIINAVKKADLLRAIAALEGIPLTHTIAVGDGANDLHMLQTAALGVAFHGKPTLRAAADLAIDDGPLDALLTHLFPATE